MSDTDNLGSGSSSSRDATARHDSDPTSEVLLDHKTPATKIGFFRTWFATSADLRPTPGSDTVKWGIHWYTPVTIVGLLLLGIASASGHHLFYSQLHRTPVGDFNRQRWVFWIGSSLGFLTKVSFTAVLGISRSQSVWVTLRRESMTIGGIDALFGAGTNPTCFINFNMLRKAKFATAIALMMWMFPLTAILTPGTISVKTVPHPSTHPCTVRTLRFPFDQDSTAKVQITGAGVEGVKIYYVGTWNIEKTMYWDTQVERVYTLASYGGNIRRAPDLSSSTNQLPSDIALAPICDQHCTYTVQFLGPSLSCTNITTWSTTEIPWSNALDFICTNEYRGERSRETHTTPIGANTPTPTAVQCRSSITRYTVQQVIENLRFNAPKILAAETSPQIVPPAEYPDPKYIPNAILRHIVFNTLHGNVTAGFSSEM